MKAIGLPSSDIVEADYPDHDMRHLAAFADGEFDVVVSDQVLEHVEGDPAQAVAEAFRVLKPGGLGVHTTCFVNPVHGVGKMGDYWRFTPDALRLLVEPHADIVACGGWGNRLGVTAIALGLRRVPVPLARFHPFHRIATRNDSRWPIVTWVVARKAA